MKEFIYEVDRIYEPAGGQMGRLYESERLLDNLNGRGKNGWQFVAAIPAIQDATGRIAAFDLVFKRETVRRKKTAPPQA